MVDTPAAIFEGTICLKDIPARLGPEPTLPICMPWDGRLEIYMPDLPDEFLSHALERLALYAFQRGLQSHYWKVTHC